LLLFQLFIVFMLLKPTIFISKFILLYTISLPLRFQSLLINGYLILSIIIIIFSIHMCAIIIFHLILYVAIFFPRVFWKCFWTMQLWNLRRYMHASVTRQQNSNSTIVSLRIWRLFTSLTSTERLNHTLKESIHLGTIYVCYFLCLILLWSKFWTKYINFCRLNFCLYLGLEVVYISLLFSDQLEFNYGLMNSFCVSCSICAGFA
jgi:hypothetical protein